jgi:hypothetical protein
MFKTILSIFFFFFVLELVPGKSHVTLVTEVSHGTFVSGDVYQEASRYYNLPDYQSNVGSLSLIMAIKPSVDSFTVPLWWVNCRV